MVVGQCQVHHGANLDLAVDDDGLVLDGVKAEHSTLRQVDNRRAHERAKNAAVADGKSPTSHVFNGELAVTSLPQMSATGYHSRGRVDWSRAGASKTYLLAQVSDGLLDADQVHALDIAHDRGDKTLLGGNGDTQIDIVPVDDGVATVLSLDGGIDDGNIAHGQDGSTGKGAHEAQLDASLLEDVILVELAELHQGGHVHLVEGSQGGGRVLRLLEALGNSKTHAVHLDLLSEKISSTRFTWLSAGGRATYTTLLSAA